MQHLNPGHQLHSGTYTIVNYIASGGFGCTYEAKHNMLESRVAIKEFFVKDFCNRDDTTAQITVGTHSKKDLVERLRKKFIDEAKALHSLHHRNIVAVQDVFEENGTAYFVMDFIDGKSLSALVKENGPLTEAQALKYIRQVADALRYVHNNNRLHLDVKPANIMVDKNDNAILIDFGASKQYDEVNGENTSTLMGKTPGYAPLEQMGNDVVQFYPSTDIYSLGATLYKILTGVTPPSANMIAAGEELPTMPGNVSAATIRAIQSSMSINRKNRPQNIDAFLAMLPSQGQESTSKPQIIKGIVETDGANDTTHIAGAATAGNSATKKGDETIVNTQPTVGGNGNSTGITPLKPKIDLDTEKQAKPHKGKSKILAITLIAAVAALVGGGVYWAYNKWFDTPNVRSITIDEFDFSSAKAFGYDDGYVEESIEDQLPITPYTDDWATAEPDSIAYVTDSTYYYD